MEGDFPANNCPAEESLQLKQGAQVMFIKNDTAHRYYNGLIGHVESIDGEHIIVKCTGSDDSIKVEPEIWENTKYALNPTTHTIDTKVQGTFTQYPLRLAWAITIHKSQGLTFKHAIIDAGMSFASGQVYVALSRCTNLEGLVLASRIIPSNIINDSRVHDYISVQQKAAEDSIRILPQLKENYYRIQLTDLFNFNRLYASQQDLYRTIVEYFHSYPRLTDFMRETLEQVKKEVLDVAYKWRNVILQMPDDKPARRSHPAEGETKCRLLCGSLEEEHPQIAQRHQGRKRQEPQGARAARRALQSLLAGIPRQRETARRDGRHNVLHRQVPQSQTRKALLDAMDTINPGSKQKRKKTKKTSSSPSYDDIM